MNSDLQNLIQLLSKLPGLGPRSGKRATLYLLQNKSLVMEPLTQALGDVLNNIQSCELCGNFDTSQPCAICRDPSRDQRQLCVIEDVADLWALERTSSFRGIYHVLGGTLSALSSTGPEKLRIPELLSRVQEREVQEVIIALNATLEGQTTAYYLQDRLNILNVKISVLAHGVPVGGELDYLDDGTLSMALKARRALAT